MQNYLLDATMSASVCGTAQIIQGQDPNMLPLVLGVFAPIIKEALFRLIDKIGTLHKQRKERKSQKNI